MKTSGFNFIDLEKDNADIGSILNTGDVNMDNELALKKKKGIKLNFDNILPKIKEKNMGLDAPIKQKNMGMDLKIKSLDDWEW